ncbi:MAG: hypothetical protein J6V50_01570 [Clostridia bacterium]|nr:hypothetical protein [Clostridia bacterium]
MVGLHQIHNAITAIETANMLGNVTSEIIKHGIRTATIPARVELVSEKPTVVLDGSHNPNGADSLAEFMKHYNNDIVAVIGMMADKDCEQFLSKILPFCESAVTVTVKENKRSMSAEDLRKLAGSFCNDVTQAESYEEAIIIAKEKSNSKKPIFVCGSLYLASAIREILKNTFK